MSVLSFVFFRSWLFLVLTGAEMSLPAQTEALSEFTLPNMGSDSTTSQFSLTSFPSPKPSLPMTSARAPDRSALSMGVPSASAPYTQTPCFLSVFMVSTRFDTLAIFIHAAAPADVLKTVGLTVALRLFGIITPSAPAASAVRIIAPRLCGSCISSHIIIKGGLPLLSAFARISSTVQYETADNAAATPPCLSPHKAFSLSSPASFTTMPCFLASAMI